MIKNIILALLTCCLCTSCIDKHFKIYNLSGELVENINLNKPSTNFDQFQLYFDKSKIDKNYEEVNLIVTDYYYYGQFFFDENFMILFFKLFKLVNIRSLFEISGIILFHLVVEFHIKLLGAYL